MAGLGSRPKGCGDRGRAGWVGEIGKEDSAASMWLVVRVNDHGGAAATIILKTDFRESVVTSNCH